MVSTMVTSGGKIVSFEIPGEPQGKGRPRFARTGKGVRTFTPEQTASYENLVKVEYERQCEGHRFDDREQLEIEVEAYFAIPKSASKRTKEMMFNENLNPIKRPDVDNILKVICDSLNQVAYRDDSQIVKASVRKCYDYNPRVVVRLWGLTNFLKASVW